MGLIGRLISLSFQATLLIGLLSAVILFLPDHLFGKVPFEAHPKQIYASNVPASVRVVQATADQVTKLNLDVPINEPESIKLHNNFIYTGVANGQILKIDEKTGKVSVLTTLVDKEAKNCEKVELSRESCGRALDMDLVGNTLLIIDTYHGFIEYDLVKNTKKTYDLRTKIPGYETNDKVFSSIRQDPANADIIYISFSSTKHGFDRIFQIFLEQEPSGILTAFNRKTGKVTVIGKGFVLSNGLEITEDKKSLLLNDLCNQRIVRYDLREVNAFLTKGGSLPKYSVFRDRIPGYPDNLTKHGKHLIAALTHHIPENELLLNKVVLPNLHLRKLLHRTFYLISEALKFVNRYYTCSCLEKVQKGFETGKVLMWLVPYKSAVAIFDQSTGALSHLIQLPIRSITHAIYNPTTGSLYFGSIAQKAIYKMNYKL